MSNKDNNFPTKAQLWKGAILGSIAHAIWLVQHPDFSNEQSWDGINYSVQDTQGTRGTITFSGEDIVGVFRDENSSRNPLPSEKGYDLDHYFVGIPPKLLSLAQDEALQYVLENYGGRIVPVITSAFWSEAIHLTARESWHEVFKHGAHVLRIQVLETEDAIREWKDNYEMDSSKTLILRSLFERKLKNPKDEIILSQKEMSVLTEDGVQGLDESQELFSSIGIIMPSSKNS